MHEYSKVEWQLDVNFRRVQMTHALNTHVIGGHMGASEVS
jgi:hypothetical protein